MNRRTEIEVNHLIFYYKGGIGDLPNNIYIHLLENNIQFAKDTDTKPRLPETYGTIIKMSRFGNFEIYGEFPEWLKDKKLTRYVVITMANCIITYDGFISKNRWGYED